MLAKLITHAPTRHEALDRLESFASVNGPAFYGLPLNEGTVTLERRPFTLPETLPWSSPAFINGLRRWS